MGFKDQFKIFPMLQTERLTLRELHSEDADDLFRLLSDEEATRYFGTEPIKNSTVAKNTIIRTKNGFARMDMIRWGISFKGDDSIIGMVTFRDFVRGPVAELGYILAKEHWHKGIMSEAVEAIIPFGFEQLGLHRIQAKVMTESMASIRLLKRLRFHEEGLLRQYPFGSWFTDTLMFSLLQTEWTS